MNQAVEKWLTVAALAGWAASIVSLVGLSLRATPSAIASRSAHAASLYTVERSRMQPKPSSSDKVAIQQELASTEIPTDTSKGYWMESLKARSSSSASWTNPHP